MKKGIVVIGYVLVVACTLCLTGGMANAENEAVFDPATLELNIPKVVIGPDAYDITLKLGAQGLTLKSFAFNNSSAFASGTYTYNASSGVLGIDFTQSTFDQRGGPSVGYFEVTVISITEDRLSNTDPDGQPESWTRIGSSGSGLTGKWLSERQNPAARTTIEFTDQGTVRYMEEFSQFAMQKKSIVIDGNFSDWEDRDRIYRDTDGPDCDGVDGRDLKEVYVAYDDYFTYVRFIMNGPLDSTFGYKFGNDIHVNVENNTLMYASGSLLPHGVHFPGSFLAITGNQIEYKIPTLKSWYDQPIQAWLDQGTDTVCRDRVRLPILIGK